MRAGILGLLHGNPFDHHSKHTLLMYVIEEMGTFVFFALSIRTITPLQIFFQSFVLYQLPFVLNNESIRELNCWTS